MARSKTTPGAAKTVEFASTIRVVKAVAFDDLEDVAAYLAEHAEKVAASRGGNFQQIWSIRAGAAAAAIRAYVDLVNSRGDDGIIIPKAEDEG